MSEAEIKYYSEELVQAIKKLQSFGDFTTEKEASQRAGQILEAALNQVHEKTVEEIAESKPVQSEDYTDNVFSLSKE